ncbi:MAG TPA: class I SAM-dependent methyltransferase [Candidatus Binatia bacterium]|jgi:2-polyprenyl-3-methyl-5-hydroxy-6-metoxy-1,4-benzoquinol methylase|nr:class I SAM-dependent methyltransferase [Candidatus Binatia bacterium]
MAATEADVGKFVEKALGDLGAALTASMVVIGDRLGLYRAMAADGAVTPAELAKRTDTVERYVREWLNAQAAAGYVTYDPATKRYTLPEAHAVSLTDENSPACMLGGFQAMTAAMRATPKIIDRFRSGDGLGWHEHDPDLFIGTERFFRPGYNANLVSSWIPALDGVQAALDRGGKVADVGCGHGASTLIMAQAFPHATITGFDYHPPSIEKARERAQAAGVAERARFEVASAQTFPGTGYDLVTFFDCLHDMGDPVGAARHVREALAPDGTWMLVEPFANDAVEDNLNPVGRIFYSVSTLVCTPASLSQEVGAALGAQAGEGRLRAVLAEAGFTRIRLATSTPFNLVIEARP